MIDVTIKADRTGIRLLNSRLTRAPRALRRHARMRFAFWAKAIIKGIRKDRSLFKYANRTDHLVKKGARKGKVKKSFRGQLTQSLWEEKGRQDAKHVEHFAGWGVNYGYVNEFGPFRKKTWVIKPRGFRSDVGRSGGSSTPIRRLRFQVGNKIVYARQVKQVWKSNRLRPHFEPWIERYEGRIVKSIERLPGRIMAGEIR